MPRNADLIKKTSNQVNWVLDIPNTSLLMAENRWLMAFFTVLMKCGVGADLMSVPPHPHMLAHVPL